jgi:diguanylate cyclase
LTLSACLMGGGIFAMHYVGMGALDASAYMIHDPIYVAASMAIAIAASGLALWLATGRGGRPPLILSAVAFGFAISGMHYTAMTGVTLYPFATASSGAPALSTDLLAIIIAIVAFCISGIFFLLLLPDTSRTEPRTSVAAAVSIAPGAEISSSAASPPSGAVAHFARRLPIEREGGTKFVGIDDVVAIHANAHYTYIFDGNDKLFCPLAISDVETRLDKARFVRVHRSHIVNVQRIIGYKRSGDSEFVQMAGPQQYFVPVSRSRIHSLKSHVAAQNGVESAMYLRRRHRLAAQ